VEAQPCPQPPVELNWYVAYTCSRHEKYLAGQCEQRGITAFLPLYAVQRQWKQRRAQVLLPLFPSYVFVRMALAERFRVLALPGIVSLVSFWLPISLKNAAKCDKWYQLQNHLITESLNANGACVEAF
jgi:transcription antitermination factor NusG